MLRTMQKVVKDLLVNEKNMLRNLELSRGMVFSQGLLLELVKKGLTREEGYALVQSAAKNVWDKNQTLKDAVLADKNILKHLSAVEIKAVFDYKYHTKNVDAIFRRVGMSDAAVKNSHTVKTAKKK